MREIADLLYLDDGNALGDPDTLLNLLKLLGADQCRIGHHRDSGEN